MSNYIFNLTDGTVLGQIAPLENNGPGAKTVRRQLVDVDVSNDNISVAGDLSYLNTGTVIDLVGGTSYDGTYSVVSAVYDATTDETTITLNAPLALAGFPLLSVATGALPTLSISGAFNGTCLFKPGTKFSFSGNIVPTTQLYTVSAVANSEQQYPVSASTTTTITTSQDVGPFFIPGLTFVASTIGSQSTRFTVQSVDPTGTIITTQEPVPALTYITVSLDVPVTSITVADPIPSGSLVVQGTVVPSAPLSVPYINAPAANAVINSTQMDVSWTLNGITQDTANSFAVGCPIVVIDGSAFNKQIMTTTYVLYTSSTGTLSITASFDTLYYPGTFSASSVSTNGTIVTGVPPIPYGAMQYEPVAWSCLQLVGKGSPYYNSTTTWGQALQNNQVHMLENWANATSPTNPLVGQTWYNTGNSTLSVNTQSGWKGAIVVTVPATGFVDMNGNKIINLADATSATDAVNLETADSLYVAKTGGVGAGRNGIMTGLLTMQDADIDLTGIGGVSISGSGGINMSGTGDITVSSGDVTVSTGALNVGTGGTGISTTISGTGIELTSSVQDQPAINVGTNRIINVSTPVANGDAVNKSYVDSLTNGIVWLQSIVDPCLFDDTMSGPVAGSAADISDPYLTRHRSFVVTPAQFTITSRNSGINGSFVVSSTSTGIQAGDVVEIPGDSTQFTITGVTPGDLGVWTVTGTAAASLLVAGMTILVSGNGNAASNVRYTVSSATVNGTDTDIQVEGSISPSSTNVGTVTVNSYSVTNVAVSGLTTITVAGNVPATGGSTLLYASGQWNGKNGHVVAYDGTNWVSVLGRTLRAGDRVGVFIDPDNEDPLTVMPSGSFANHAGSIMTVGSVDSNYVVTWDTPIYNPAEPDAVSILGVYSPHFGNSYTFRGQYGVGSFGTGYKWIEFAGPGVVIDGAGLRYTGSTLNVGAGPGITVTADAVSLSTAYVDALYLRLDGTSAMSGGLNMNNNPITGVPAPAVGASTTSVPNKGYVDTTFVAISGTSTMVGSLNMGANKIINLAAPTTSTDAVNLSFANTTYLSKSGGALAGMLDLTNHAVINVTDPVNPQDVATKNYVDSVSGAFLSTTGGTMTGNINMNNVYRVINLAAPTNSGDAVNKDYADITFLPLAGGTLSGPLTLSADPTTSLQAATKGYVDAVISPLATNASVVHLTGSETIIGTKTFASAQVFNGPVSIASDATTNNVVISPTEITMVGTTVTGGGASAVSITAGGNNGGAGGTTTLAAGNGSTTGGDVIINGGEGSAGLGGNITLTTGTGTTGNGTLTMSVDGGGPLSVIMYPTGSISVGGAVPATFNQAIVASQVNPAQKSPSWKTVAVQSTPPTTSATYSITAVTAGVNGTITITGDQSTIFVVGTMLTLSGNTDSASNASYVVQAVVFNGTSTVITVSLLPPTATVSGVIAPGAPGMWYSDDAYFYVFGATSWKRVALSSF